MATPGNLPVIGDLLVSKQRLEIWCQHQGCPHEVLWSPEEAVAKLGANTTYVEARRMLKCSACDARGRDRQIGIRASVADFYAIQDEQKIARYEAEYGSEAAELLRQRLGRPKVDRQ